jgi:hypothetical protein
MGRENIILREQRKKTFTPLADATPTTSDGFDEALC